MSEFVEFLHEVFRQFGTITSRRMFGGYGIYHDGLMFGLVAEDELYLKADDQAAPWFETRGLEQFEYVKKGRAMKMSYFLAPEEIFDDPELALKWAWHSYAAALRSKEPSRRA